MKKHWIVSLVLLVIATGCGPTETAERAAQDTLQDQKVRAALAKQTRGSMSMPKELGPEDSAPPKDSAAPKDSATEETVQLKGGDEDQADASPKRKAQQVLNDAVAKAKSENKALFVHFTADW